MAQVRPIAPENVQGELKEIFDSVQRKMGKVPNIFQNMANSPAVLKAYLGLSEQAGQTTLDAKLREQIALAVAETNACTYCLAAHSAAAKALGLGDDELP